MLREKIASCSAAGMRPLCDRHHSHEALTSASGNWMAAVAAACFAPFALVFISMLVVKLSNRHAG